MGLVYPVQIYLDPSSAVARQVPSTYLSISLSIYLSIYPYKYLSLSIRPSIYLSIYIGIYLSIYLSIYSQLVLESLGNLAEYAYPRRVLRACKARSVYAR